MSNSSFTPEQIQEILNIYFENFAHRQYIGARYVPIFGRKDEDSIEWDNTKAYEPLTIVLYQGNSYTSRQFVPIGVEITNEIYWAETGNYNAQVEAYRQEVLTFNERITYLENQFFDTVNDMANCNTLEVGMICHTNGFYTADDCGSAWYEIVDDEIPNNINLIQLKNHLIGKLIYNPKEIFVSQFGAIGDDITDDTDKIKQAVSCLDNYSRLIFECGKKYIISDTIDIDKSYVNIEGLGENDVTPVIEAENLDIFFNITTPGIVFENLNIKNIGNNKTGCGVYIKRNNPNIDSKVFNCIFSQLEIGIYICGRNITIDNSMFSFCKNGIIFNSYREDGASAADKTMRGWIVQNCRFHGIGSQDTPTLSQMEFSSLDEIDSWAIQTDLYNDVTIQNITIVNNVCDVSRNAAFYKGYSNGLMLHNNSISKGVYTFSILAYLFNSGQTQYSIGSIANNIVSSRANSFYTQETNDDTNLAGFWHFIVSKNAQRYLKISDNCFDDSTREGIKIEGREIQIINNMINSTGYGIPSGSPSSFIYVKPTGIGSVQVQGNFGNQNYEAKQSTAYDVYTDGAIRINSNCIMNNSFVSTVVDINHMDCLNHTWTPATNAARFIINDQVKGSDTVRKVLELKPNAINYLQIAMDGTATNIWSIPIE